MTNLNTNTAARNASSMLRFAHKDMSPLSEKELRQYAPAIYTEQPRGDFRKSNRYQHVATFELMDAMRAEGFQPVEVQTYARRDPKRVPYAMHMLRFSEISSKGALREVGDVAPQIVLRNSHDGSSPFEIWSGLFRKVCSNGLIVSDSNIVQPIHVRHTTRAVLEAMVGVLELAERQKGVLEHISAMRALKLGRPQQVHFAAQALALRPNVAGVIQAEALLNERRAQDKGDDLWHVFNRVQENIMVGGLEGETANKRRTVVRSVNSISATLDINSRLWTLAMEAIAKAAGSSKHATDGAAVAVQ